MDFLREIWPSLSLTLYLALISTALLFVISTPLAWWLARSKSPVVPYISAFVTLPLVLPPTVLGFYLLLALGPHGVGGFVGQWFGMRTLAFSFPGLIIGSVVYSLPFVVQPLRNGFEAIGNEPIEAAYSLGATKNQAFWRVVLPLARPSYITGGVLGFAHTIGEFGVVMMIGGNIGGKTKVLSISMFEFVEQLRWTEAHILAAGMVVFGFLTVAITMTVGREKGLIVR